MSTVGTSTETATGLQTSPSAKEQNAKFRISPSDRRPDLHIPQAGDDSALRQTVPSGRRLSFGAESLRRPANDSSSNLGDSIDSITSPDTSVAEVSLPRRGLWNWAKAGTERWGIMGRIYYASNEPHTDGAPKATHLAGSASSSSHSTPLSSRLPSPLSESLRMKARKRQ